MSFSLSRKFTIYNFNLVILLLFFVLHSTGDLVSTNPTSSTASYNIGFAVGTPFLSVYCVQLILNT